jgi:streptogramin lyase
VHKGFIDSGGANPTRVKLMYGGKIVVAASGGVFRGNANGGLAPTGVTGNVLKLIGDPVEGQFVAAIMQDGRIAMFYPEGPPKVSAPFGEMPSAALAGNRIYVVHYGSDSIAWFDPKDPSKVEQKSLSKGARPFDLAINANQVWVTETGLKQVAVMDTGSQSISEIELSFMPTLIAFSPDGCVAVVYGKDDGEFAKLDPKRRSMFDLVQRLPQPPQVIGLRIDLRQELYFVLPDGKMQGAYYASCPLP